MKLVLKHNDSIKLYSLALDYDTLVHFICKEFRIRREDLELSFLDEEGDNITILSNDDIEVMTSLFQGKDYVKVQVTGEIIQEPQNQQQNVSHIQEQNQSSAIEVQEPKVEKLQIKEVIQIVKQLIEEDKQAIESKVQKSNVQVIQNLGQKEQQRHQKKQCWMKRKWQKMLNEKVAFLVDQRFQALLPCFKQQLFNKEKKVQMNDQNALIHESFQCKACLMKPIKGIRYQCLKCPNFNFCQNCQPKIDHEHNLLKIKKICKKDEQKGFFNKQCYNGQSSDHSRQKHHRRHHHHKHHHGGKGFAKAEGLTMMFGGKFEDYADFIYESKGLSPRQTYRKYATLKNLSQEQFITIFTRYRSQKLSKLFGKPAETYSAIVKDTIKLRYSQLIDCIYEKGIEVKTEQNGRGNCKKWWGKRYNFNQECLNQKMQKKQNLNIQIKSEQKQQIAAQPIIVVSKKEEVIPEVIKKEDQKPKDNPSLLISDSILMQPKPLDTQQVRVQKAKILIQLRQIFGDENSKDYMKIIDKYYKQGGQAIIVRWIEGNRQ